MRNIIEFISEGKEYSFTYDVSDNASIGNNGLERTKRYNRFLQEIRQNSPMKFKVTITGMGTKYPDLTAYCSHNTGNMYTVKEYNMGSVHEFEMANIPDVLIKHLIVIYKKNCK